MAGRWTSAVPRRALQPVDETELDQPGSEASVAEQLSFGQHVLAFFKELAAVIVGAVIVASLLRGFVGQMFLIPSISMENTLQVRRPRCRGQARCDQARTGGRLHKTQAAGSLASPRASEVQSAKCSSSWVCCLTPAPST